MGEGGFEFGGGGGFGGAGVFSGPQFDTFNDGAIFNQTILDSLPQQDLSTPEGLAQFSQQLQGYQESLLRNEIGSLRSGQRTPDQAIENLLRLSISTGIGFPQIVPRIQGAAQSVALESELPSFNFDFGGGGGGFDFTNTSSGGFDLGSIPGIGDLLGSGGGGGDSGGGGIGDIFGGILGGIGDILGDIPILGGVLQGGADVLGGILGGAGDVLGGLLGGLLGGGGGGSQQQQPGINQLISQLFGNVGQGGGSGSQAGNALSLLLGGLFGENLSEVRGESRNTLPPASAQELQLLGVNVDLAGKQLQAFSQALDQSGVQNQFLRDTLTQLDTERQAVQQKLGISPEAAIGQTRADAFERLQGLGQQEQLTTEQLLSDFQRGNTASEADLSRIREASDLAVQSGLSDLSRFEADQFERIRESSAQRGLRPSDTPILSQFQDLGEETTRNAQQLVSGIRQAQLGQELNFPLARGQLGLGQFSSLSNALQGQRAQGQSILEQGQQNRLGLTGQANSLAGGLAPGANPAAPLGILADTRTRSATQTNIGNPSALTSFAEGSRAAGSILEELGLFQ